MQGLGVRPAVYRLAVDLRLGGTIRNTGRGVEIEVEGSIGQLKQFECRLRDALPAAAIVTQWQIDQFAPLGRQDFTIDKQPAQGPLAVRVPEDRVLCERCAGEIGHPADRRARYPFTSCTQCGPRYTVIRAMPFERADTTMASFPLCTKCRDEYLRPDDPRFHAQTTACPACGPQAWFTDARGNTAFEDNGLRAAVACLTSGQIVALRGVGGYQLLVDATNGAAVERLRERKGRRVKPFAVLVESARAARQLARFDPAELEAFSDPSGPIVLVRATPDNGLANAIHPGLHTVGLMGPTTPLHALLARDLGRPLVCTSGNREGEPLEYEVAAAQQRLAGIADAWLHHNRELERPLDDSVVQIIAGRRVTIRLARGLAPLPLDLSSLPPTLAVGGYFKAAAAWSNGAQAVLGPHVGDQESLSSRERFLAQIEDWQSLYGFRPQQIVHDLHPSYFSAVWAQRQDVSSLAVQHHHAHIVAGMLEHGWMRRRVLGVAWDGTGYGSDGTIWGGEFLVATAANFNRVARLRPFRLPGGEAAIREPWRIAVAVCPQIERWPCWNLSTRQWSSVRQIADRDQFSPWTSSAGRLFDAAAALILGIARVDFDGQAAMQLEAIADPTAAGVYPFPLRNRQPAELDWRPLFAQLLADCRRGVEPGVLAMRFHRTLASGIAGVCRRWPDLPVVLAGGVFQNRLLTELVVERMAEEQQPMGLPGVIPPNDGGLAAGQLAIAAARGNVLSCA